MPYATHSLPTVNKPYQHQMRELISSGKEVNNWKSSPLRGLHVLDRYGKALVSVEEPQHVTAEHETCYIFLSFMIIIIN